MKFKLVENIEYINENYSDDDINSVEYVVNKYFASHQQSDYVQLIAISQYSNKDSSKEAFIYRNLYQADIYFILKNYFKKDYSVKMVDSTLYVKEN